MTLRIYVIHFKYYYHECIKNNLLPVLHTVIVLLDCGKMSVLEKSNLN